MDGFVGYNRSFSPILLIIYPEDIKQSRARDMEAQFMERG